VGLVQQQPTVATTNYAPTPPRFPDGTVCRSNDTGADYPVVVTVLNHSDALVSVRFGGVHDCSKGTSAGAARAAEDWTITLGQGLRHLTLNAKGRGLAKQSAGKHLLGVATRVTRRSLYLRSRSINGLFDRGYAQGGNGQGQALRCDGKGAASLCPSVPLSLCPSVPLCL
jgi:hypothetical protein